MEIKKIILRVFFIGEIALFLGFYFFGAHGLPQIREYKKQNAQLVGDISQLEKQVSNITRELEEWETYPFYKERFARQELQMGKPGEELYLYPKGT